MIELGQEQEHERPSQPEVTVSPYYDHDNKFYDDHPNKSQEDFYAGVRSFLRLPAERALTGFEDWPTSAETPIYLDD